MYNYYIINPYVFIHRLARLFQDGHGIKIDEFVEHLAEIYHFHLHPEHLGSSSEHNSPATAVSINVHVCIYSYTHQYNLFLCTLRIYTNSLYVMYECAIL